MNRKRKQRGIDLDDEIEGKKKREKKVYAESDTMLCQFNRTRCCRFAQCNAMHRSKKATKALYVGITI